MCYKSLSYREKNATCGKSKQFIQENNVACKKVKCKRRFDVDKKDKSKP